MANVTVVPEQMTRAELATAKPRGEARFRRLLQRLYDLRTRAGRQAALERTGYQGALFHTWLFPLTRHGKLLLLAFAMTALPASISAEVPIYEVAVGVVCLLLVTTFVGSCYRWVRTDLDGRFPAFVVAGEPLRGTFRLTNRGWFNLYDLSVGCFRPPPGLQSVPDSSSIDVVAKGASAEFEVTLIARRRGCHVLPPVRVFTLFPFGIGRNELSRVRPGGVVVLPRPAQVHMRFVSDLAASNDDGKASRRAAAEPLEYLGSRDYVAGDDLRRIDYHAWGRWGRPMVREFASPSSSGPILILDPRVPTNLPQDWRTTGRTRRRTDSTTPPTIPARVAGFAIRSLDLVATGIEALLPDTTGALRRYQSELLEAAVSLAAGVLSEWRTGTATAQFRCTAWDEAYDIDPGSSGFEIVWERLAHPLLAQPTRCEEIVDELLQPGGRPGDDVLWIGCVWDDAAQAAVARLVRAGLHVRNMWLTRTQIQVAGSEAARRVTPAAVSTEIIHVD